MSDRTCPICCGVVPEKAATGPRATYCSSRCRSRASYLRRGDQMNAQRTAASAARRAATVKTCKECGVAFTPVKSMGQLFCGPSCSRRSSRYTTSRTCSVDGCDRVHNARGLCKMHWRRVARSEGRERAPVWDDRRRASKKMRLSVTRGALAAETFVYADVYDRDGWVCGICGDAVAQDLAYPDPMSVSLDHVVPVSVGGGHTLDNVQCAHLACNLRKGVRPAVDSVLSA